MNTHKKIFILSLSVHTMFIFAPRSCAQKQDQDFDAILKNLEKMIDTYEKDASKIEFPKKAGKLPSASALPQQKPLVAPSPAAVKKDIRTNFIESFQPPAKAPAAEKPGAKVENVLLPVFKTEALDLYLSNFLLTLVSLRKRIASADIYRRTKTFAPYTDQLNEIEMLLWEIIHSSTYHMSFFAPQFKNFRILLLSVGKQLETIKNTLNLPEKEERTITSREEFEKLKPEKSTSEIQLKKLTTLFDKDLGGLINDARGVIKAAGKDIEEIKKKNITEQKDAEKRLKDLESRAAKYRPSDYSGASFWDSQSPFKFDFDKGFGGMGGGDYFGGGFPSDFGFPGEEGFDQEGAQGFGGGGGSPEALKGEGEKEEKEQKDKKDKGEGKKTNLDRERELKNEIILLVEDAQQAFEDDNLDQAREIITFIKSLKGPLRELNLLETSLYPQRMQAKEWADLDMRYRGALRALEELAQKVGFPPDEIKNVEQKLAEQAQEIKAIDKEYDAQEKKILDELKPYAADIAFIAQSIKTHNTEKNVLKLSEIQQDALDSLSKLDPKKQDPSLLEELKKSSVLVDLMQTVDQFLANREKQSPKFTLLLTKLEALKNAQVEYAKKIYEATAPAQESTAKIKPKPISKEKKEDT